MLVIFQSLHKKPKLNSLRVLSETNMEGKPIILTY
jgi:hypothetical protein